MRQLIRRCLLLVLLALVTVASVPAAAGPPSTAVKQARVKFRKGTKLYKRGMYLAALEQFRAAQKLYPSFKIDLNIAGTLQALGRLAEAATSYERFILQSSSAPAAFITSARAQLAKLKQQLASVSVSSPVRGADVSINGVTIGSTPLDMPHYLKPGSVALVVQKRGALFFSRKLQLKAGDHPKINAVTEGGKDKQRAKVLFADGTALFQKGLYVDALKKYRAARSIYPSYKIDLNIGSTLDAMGRRAEAAHYFRKFVLAAKKAPAAIRASAQNRLTWLKRNLASVKVTSVLNGVTVLVDDEVVGTTPIDLPLFMEPGARKLGAKMALYLPFARELALKPGQHIKFPLPLKLVAEDRAYRERVLRLEIRRKKSIWAYSTLGVGLALAAGAGVLYGVGYSQGSSAHDSYLATNSPADLERYSDDIGAAQAMVISAHVMAGVAVASLAISTYQFITRPAVERGDPAASPPPARAPGARAGLGLTPVVGGAFLSLSGRY